MNAVSHSDNAEAARLQICRRAAQPYLNADRFAYHFARVKLQADPLFTDVLLSGALSGCHHLLDLGCGQGLLTAWLQAAQLQRTESAWPTGWPEPPRPARIRGVDLRTSSIRRAQAAWGQQAIFQVQDIRQADCNGADATLILDVLHYIDFAEQQALLERIRSALKPPGVLIMRVADASGGFAFRFGQWIDQIHELVRDRRQSPLFCRTLPQWLTLLQSCGFKAQPLTNSSGKSFSNTLLIAHAA